MQTRDSYAELVRARSIVSSSVARLLAIGTLLTGLFGTAHAQQCVLEENGSGTVDLPLQCAGGYGNPEDYHVITDGLPPGTSICVQVIWGSFTSVVRTPGGNLGGEIQTFVPSIIMNMRGTGELDSFVHFTPLVNTFGEEHSGSYPAFSDLQKIPLELVEMWGEGRSFDPYFSVLRYEIGSGLGLPVTTGQAKLQLDRPGECAGGLLDGEPCARDDECPDSSTDGFCEGGEHDGQPCADRGNCPGGVCVNRGSCVCPGGPCVPSYAANGLFDAEYALEYEGKPEGPLAGYSGRSTGHIRMYTGAFATMLMRPPGSDFREMTVDPGETFVIDTYARQLVPARLWAYRVSLPMEATEIRPGGRGTIRHAPYPPSITKASPPWVFYGMTPVWWCTLYPFPSCGAYFFSPPSEGFPVVTHQKYLAHFTYEVSSDAAGDFEIEFLDPGVYPDALTCLADENLEGIAFEPYGAIVHVTGRPCDDPVSGPPALVHGTADAGETYPCTGYIDPRLESANGVDVNLGVREVIVVFNEPVFKVGSTCGDAPADITSFVVTETGGGPPPVVVDVATSDNTSFTVTLDRPITLQEWTTIRADVVDTVGNPITNDGDLGEGVAEPDRLDIAFLPSDLNQDAQVTPRDLINLWQFLMRNSFHNACVDILYFDIDRDGVMPEPADSIRFKQMISGTPPATRNWTLAQLNSMQP